MPDINGNYLGDQATVMPDNTAAFMHYSDQFVQNEQNRRQQLAAQQKQEQDRQSRVQAGINKDIYNPSYLKNDATNPIIRENMDRMDAEAKVVYKTKGEAAAIDAINKSAMDLGAGVERIAQTNKSMTDAIAHYQVQHPDWDGASAMHLAATNSWFKKDKDGNLVHKQLGEINPNDDFLENVRNGEHGADLYHDQASLKETNAMIDKEKIEDVNQDQTFNDDGSNKVLGYKGKVATRLTDPALVDGKMQAVTRNNSYRLPNQKPFFLDNSGNSVQVLPKELHDQFYGSNDGFKAKVDRMVKDELAKPVNLDGKGEMQFSPDSDYADMLRKKFSYDYLNNQLKNKYSINSVDNSDAEMRKVNAEILANKRFDLSEHRSIMQDRKTNAILDKANANTPINMPDFLGSMNDKYGQDLENVQTVRGKASTWHVFSPNEPAIPAQTGNLRVIPATADARDLDLIAGKPNTKGVRPIAPQTFTNADGTLVLAEDGKPLKGWSYNPETGNATGLGGKVIDKATVQREFLNHTKKASIPKILSETPIIKTAEKIEPKKLILTGNIR